MTINERIKYYRKAAGLTQAELAKKAGYSSHSAIAKIEKGELELPASKIAKFAEIFGVSPSDLLGHTEVKADALTEEERQILRAYREAEPNIRDAVATILQVRRLSAYYEKLKELTEKKEK